MKDDQLKPAKDDQLKLAKDIETVLESHGYEKPAFNIVWSAEPHKALLCTGNCNFNETIFRFTKIASKMMEEKIIKKPKE